MKIDRFNMNIDKNNVFRTLEIAENTTVYEEADILFNECEKDFYNYVKPYCLYELKNEKTGIYKFSVFVIMSLGNTISDIINNYFDEGDYFKALILNGICDDFLMQTDKIVIAEISDFICNKNIGFGERFYPHENIEADKMLDIVENVNGYDYGISVNQSFVLKPSKSIAFIIGCDVNINNKICHNCGICKRKNCKWRKSNDKNKC